MVIKVRIQTKLKQKIFESNVNWPIFTTVLYILLIWIALDCILSQMLPSLLGNTDMFGT